MCESFAATVSQALEFGLGTCAIKSYNDGAVRKLLGIPDTLRIEILISVGYPDGEPRERKRKDLDQTHFTGASDMGSAAGADIRVLNRHDSHRALQFFLGTIGNLFPFFFGGISDDDRLIGPDDLIGLPFNFSDLIGIQPAAVIDLNRIAHMKADIFISVQLMNDTGHDMLTGMILHEIKTSVPVDHAMDFRTGREFFFRIMNDFVILFFDIGDPDVIQKTVISRLAAAFRIKDRLIKNDCPSLFVCRAAQDDRVKFPPVLILIKKCIHICHNNSPSFKIIPKEKTGSRV